MLDVLIVGAGPAGTVAGTVLARAGARVRLIDRARFPRDKLCGDTVNPGALARLAALGLADDVQTRGLPVGGMLVTGERGVAIEGRYPDGVFGRAIVRRELDSLLLQHALAAGCEFEDGVAARGAIVSDDDGGRSVRGVVINGSGGDRTLDARVIIAADGRRSSIAFGLGLARHPARPRRWAIGAYFDNFGSPQPGNAKRAEPAKHAAQSSENNSLRPLRALRSMSSAMSEMPMRGELAAEDALRVQGLRCASVLGEMHIRRGRYIGVAAMPGGLTNVCLVRPSRGGDAELRDPAALLVRELQRDPLLRERAAGARVATAPIVLGPLAVDVRDEQIDGLLLAGDAAGFIDPMTGDGLRFAIRGGELAAAAASRALAQGWSGVHAEHAAARRAEFNGKWRFNRALRALVASPRAVDAAAVAAALTPGVLRAVIAHAGDCHTSDTATHRTALR